MRVWGLLTALTGSIAIHAASASNLTAPCTQLQGTRPEAMLEYLQADRGKLDDACVIVALDQFGRAVYQPAIRSLIRFLDYRISDPPKTDEGVVQRKIP